MRTITATELRAKLGEVLDAASAGERILIERDRKPLAMLISVEEMASREAEEAAVAEEIAALDALISIGEEWRRTHPPDARELSGAATVRMDRDRDEPEDPS